MLLRNYSALNGNPGREFGGAANPIKWMKSSSMQLFYGGEASVEGQTNKAGFPCGYGTGGSFSLPPKAGGLSSHFEGNISLSQTGVAVGGKPISGSSDITFTTTATGGLIVSGSGSASITLSPTGTLISVAAGSGSATVTLSGTALIGALAGISGQGSITLSPTAAIKAIGYLAGLSTNETEFSADALARAVWDATATDFNLAGTMGEKLNDAGSAGNPWAALIADNGDPGTFGERVQKLLTTAKFLALK